MCSQAIYKQPLNSWIDHCEIAGQCTGGIPDMKHLFHCLSKRYRCLFLGLLPLHLFVNLLRARGGFEEFFFFFFRYDLIRLVPLNFTFIVYCAASSEEESNEGYPGGVIPVGRGLSTMTRPTT